jgi:hypothetical protein
MHVAPIRTEVDDRVADKLTGTVIGDISAAPRLVDFYPTLRQKLTAGEDVRTPAVAFDAQRQHMRVLHKQQYVVGASRSTLLNQLTLKRQRLGIRNQAGTADD